MSALRLMIIKTLSDLLPVDKSCGWQINQTGTNSWDCLTGIYLVNPYLVIFLCQRFSCQSLAICFWRQP